MEYRTLSHRVFKWLENTLSAPPWIAGIALSLLFGSFALWFCWVTGIVAEVNAGRQPDIAVRADLAMEQRLQSVGEWPFDAGSYGRVVLYIFLGFGSWIGAALVERGLELAY